MKVHFSDDEVKTKTLLYFEGDDLATQVWMTKYALKYNNQFLEETPDDSIRRYTYELYRIEKKYSNPMDKEQIYNLLKDYNYFILAGSPMFGIGNKDEVVSLGNCFCVGNYEDSYAGIMVTDESLVQLMKRRGGVGTDISHLRPKGYVTRNAAKISTGAVSFMNRFSNTTREVAQDGRRGALMITMNVNHPDILDFITVKDDLSKITGANISVKITDKFMEAVESDSDFELVFNDSITTIKAKKVWDTIVHQAWKSAEPGILFWDKIIENSPADCYEEFQTVTTNPCQPGKATVLTPFGISTIESIKIGDIIWSKEGWTHVINKVSSGKQKVFKYSTTFGNVCCTRNHKIIQNGVKIQIKNASSIDLLRGEDPGILCPGGYRAIMDGLVLGDGSVHKDSNNLVHLYIGKNDQDYFTSIIRGFIKKHRSGIKHNAYEIDTSITAEELPKTYKRTIPIRYFTGNCYYVKQFLKGLYSANGSVVANRVTLKASSKELIEQVQLMLNSLGIASYITINKTHPVKFNNGIYQCRKSYDLNITRDRGLFLEKIGFLQKYKNEALSKNVNLSNSTEAISKNIITTEFIGREEVFDITVDNNTHTYWSGGHNISNCGELPLSYYDSCRLAALNIYAHIKNPFTLDAEIDFELLFANARLAQRLMDNMIDLELEKIEQILNKIRYSKELFKDREHELWVKIQRSVFNGRRTGLGLTGLADAAAALGIKYGSLDFQEFAEVIQETISKGSYSESINLAKERGAFPVFDLKKEQDHKFIKHMFEEAPPDIIQDYKTYGRRNIANLTIAPTGSLSILARVSSGIEPVYSLEYKRRRKVSDEIDKALVDELGDFWVEYDVLHSKYEKFVEITGITEVERSPYYQATANEIDYLSKIDTQALMQHWIDHSISVTHNLPSNITEEEVSDIYFRAWKTGCKGVTIYREGCRDGVLIAKEKEKFTINHAPKRPRKLPGEAFGTTVLGQKFTVVVGLLNDRPYEVFAYKGNDLSGKGHIIKIKKGTYKFVSNGQEEIITDDLTDEQEAITRGYSFGLRHGGHVKFATEQLNKTKGDLSSFNKAIARVFKRFVTDGEDSSESCPQCNHRLVYESGCLLCKNCGYSKC